MIVTCERCSARYKLDDSKIKGRGARITCPKCQHVFVVYNKAAESAPDQPEPDDDPEDPSSDEAPLPGSNNPLAQDPTSGSGLLGTGPRADSLDFRKVGISTWKVKVKIGLVYDFSDIGTLRKYIQDRRVTEDDVISHDGASWVRIGDIPDLDAYFVQVYEELEDQLTGGGEDEEATTGEPFEDDGPTMVVGMGSLRSNISTGVFQRPGAKGGDASTTRPLPPKPSPGPSGPTVGDSRFVDPFESLKQRQRDRLRAKRRPDGSVTTGMHRKNGAKAPEPSKRRLNPWLIAAGVVGVAAVVWFFFLRPPPVTTLPTQVTQPSAQNAQQVEMTAAKAREQLLGKLEGALVEAQGDKPPVDESLPGDEGLPQYLSPADKARMCKSGELSGPVCASAGSVPDNRGSSPGTTSSSPEAGSTSTAADHASVGATAARQSKWEDAINAYSQAVKLSPNTAAYRQGLGLAYYNAGKLDKAKEQFQVLEKAGDVGALLYLARIAKQQGDVFGAGEYYNKYLAKKPGDPEATRELQELN